MEIDQMEETKTVETDETKIRIGQHLLQPQNHTVQEVLYRNVSSLLKFNYLFHFRLPKDRRFLKEPQIMF